jgi:hypothetical protein
MPHAIDNLLDDDGNEVLERPENFGTTGKYETEALTLTPKGIYQFSHNYKITNTVLLKGNGDSDSNLTGDGDGNGDNSTCGSSYRGTLHLCDPDNKLAL